MDLTSEHFPNILSSSLTRPCQTGDVLEIGRVMSGDVTVRVRVISRRMDLT